MVVAGSPRLVDQEVRLMDLRGDDEVVLENFPLRGRNPATSSSSPVEAVEQPHKIKDFLLLASYYVPLDQGDLLRRVEKAIKKYPAPEPLDYVLKSVVHQGMSYDQRAKVIEEISTVPVNTLLTFLNAFTILGLGLDATQCVDLIKILVSYANPTHLLEFVGVCKKHVEWVQNSGQRLDLIKNLKKISSKHWLEMTGMISCFIEHRYPMPEEICSYVRIFSSLDHKKWNSLFGKFLVKSVEWSFCRADYILSSYAAVPKDRWKAFEEFMLPYIGIGDYESRGPFILSLARVYQRQDKEFFPFLDDVRTKFSVDINYPSFVDSLTYIQPKDRMPFKGFLGMFQVAGYNLTSEVIAHLCEYSFNQKRLLDDDLFKIMGKLPFILRRQEFLSTALYYLGHTPAEHQHELAELVNMLYVRTMELNDFSAIIKTLFDTRQEDREPVATLTKKLIPYVSKGEYKTAIFTKIKQQQKEKRERFVNMLLKLKETTDEFDGTIETIEIPIGNEELYTITDILADVPHYLWSGFVDTVNYFMKGSDDPEKLVRVVNTVYSNSQLYTKVENTNAPGKAQLLKSSALKFILKTKQEKSRFEDCVTDFETYIGQQVSMASPWILEEQENKIPLYKNVLRVLKGASQEGDMGSSIVENKKFDQSVEYGMQALFKAVWLFIKDYREPDLRSLLVKGLANCIEEDNHRICEQGQAQNLLMVVQGYDPDVILEPQASETLSHVPSVMDLQAQFFSSIGKAPKEKGEAWEVWVRGLREEALKTAKQVYEESMPEYREFLDLTESYIQLCE